MKSPKNSRFRKKNRRLTLLFVFFLCAISLTLLIVYSNSGGKTTTEIKESILETKEPIVEIAKPIIEEIIPSEKTEFFSKENGKSLLWYTMVNDSIVFYKTKGVHPITGQDLKPVTEVIINKYKESLKPEKKAVALKDNRNYKVGEVKIIKKKKKPVVVKKKIVRESIWNSDLSNSRDTDEVSLFVFNAIYQIDPVLTKRFKEEFEKKGYFITKEVIHYDVLTPKMAANLESKNVDYFEGNLEKYTDYICYAKASYEYKQNRYRDDFLDCTMTIDYCIYSSATGEILVSEKDEVIGSDQNKKTAKLRAIEKFIL